MADYTISAKITGDASGYESAVNKASKASSKLSKTVSDVLKGFGKGGLGSSLGQIALGFGSVTTAVSVCTKTLKGCVKAINETSEAYKGQMKVERQLEQASKNNPYITEDSIKRLKAYASEIQSISNYGDEELIGKMSQLVALGRDEAEVMKIIKVATDMSADDTMTLDTAITQLNATLNGNVGRLGQQNKELKTLTQGELESGKAIDILGEKFKGMAEATADTSKQMKNLKGDFKEAIGRFTLPTSDLWNNFWSGFYDLGAKVINKLSDDIEKRAINKALAQYGEQNYQTILKGIDRKQSTQKSALGIKSYARSMTSSMLDVTVSYLENEYPQLIQDSQTEEGIIYNILKAEQSRKQEIKKEREEEEARLQKLAEEQAKQKRLNEEQTKFVTDLKQKHLDAIKQKEEEWKYTEEITGKEVDTNEKLSFYQKDLIDIMTEGAGLITKDNEYYKQQIAIINDLKGEHTENNELQEKWNAKLLDQKIEMLETERDRAIELAEEEGKDTYSVMSDYNDKILELKLERLAKEKEKALEEEELTAEGKIFIEEYYKNEALKIIEELKNKKKKKNEDEKKDEKNKFAIMLGYAKQYLDKMKQIFSKVVSTISKVIKSGIDVIKKLISINISDILDTVLAFEDSVLTFFVEILPNLPKMIGSIIQSIKVLFKNLKANIKAETIADVIFTMLKQLSDSLPSLISDLLDILTELLNGAIDGLIRWLDEEDGLQTIFRLLLKIQKVAEDFVSNNLGKIVDMLSKHVDDIANFLAESMTSANKTLPKIIKAVTKFIITIIQIIGKIFENKEFVDSMVQAIIDIVKILLDNLPRLIDSLVTAIISIIKALTPYLPRILSTLISAIFEAIPSVMDSLIKGFGEIFKTIFTAIFNGDFWKDVFGGIGEIFNNLFKKKDGAGGTEGYGSNSTGSTAGDIAVDFLVPFGFLRHFFANGTQNAPSGLSVVGEAGPELVKFRGGEQVINNRNTQKLLANANGSTNNFNVTFNNLQDTSAYAMMNQLKQYNRQMAINGIL